jgi:HEPN domain-containing protein
MKPLAAEWIAKAEADLRTARRELRARIEPNFDAVCFHAQQSAEKYLKAACVQAGVDFPKTHDVAALLALLAPSSLALATRDEVEANMVEAIRLHLDGLREDGLVIPPAEAFAEVVAIA